MFLRALNAEVEFRRVRDWTVQVQGPPVKLGMGKEGFVLGGCGAGSDSGWWLLIIMHCVVSLMSSVLHENPSS